MPRRSLGFRSVAAWQKGRAEFKSLRDGAKVAAPLLAMLGFVDP